MEEADGLEAFGLEAALQSRRENLLYRRRLTLDSPQGPEVIIDGRHYLAFCSNDYLGLANHPAIVASFRRAVDTYGMGGGASHLIVGHSRPHHQLEEELAAFTRRPRALLFSTGYMANLGVMNALLDSGDAVFQDRLNHASLLDAGRLSGSRWQRYRHADLDHLEQRLNTSGARRRLIATDGVFSMDGDHAPLHGLVALAKKYRAALMVDDAHGFGTTGQGGRGSASLYNLSISDLPILMGTLGKAFGTAGAFVAGSETLVETLIQFSRSYIYTTAMPPAIAEATRTSLRIVEKEEWRREHLTDLIGYFRRGCHSLGIKLMASSTPIQPVLVGAVQRVLDISRMLTEDGILVLPIRPPTVARGASRLRITLCAAHQKHHVDRLLEAIGKAVCSCPEQAA